MKICPSCSAKFTDDKKFCKEDGSELKPFEMPEENLTDFSVKHMQSEFDENVKNDSSFKPARITLKIGGNLSDKFFDLNSNDLTCGRFDSSGGLIDIDLSGFPGSEHISRKHGRFTYSNDKWCLSDADSTNGIFIKKAGESEFSSRIIEPVELNSGDEISFGSMVFLFTI
jgi:pSer/pThr/pTyr-binding forkhead associated (FHA) protein